MNKVIINPEELLIEGLKFISPYSGDICIITKDSSINKNMIINVDKPNLNLKKCNVFWKSNNKLAVITYIPNQEIVIDNFQIY